MPSAEVLSLAGVASAQRVMIVHELANDHLRFSISADGSCGPAHVLILEKGRARDSSPRFGGDIRLLKLGLVSLFIVGGELSEVLHPDPVAEVPEPLAGASCILIDRQEGYDRVHELARRTPSPLSSPTS